MKDNYYVSGYEYGGYKVRSFHQGSCNVATFVCESEAEDYCKYRNKMMHKFNTTDVGKYKH